MIALELIKGNFVCLTSLVEEDHLTIPQMPRFFSSELGDPGGFLVCVWSLRKGLRGLKP